MQWVLAVVTEDLAAFGNFPRRAPKELVEILALWLYWEDTWSY